MQKARNKRGCSLMENERKLNRLRTYKYLLIVMLIVSLARCSKLEKVLQVKS